jgi:hypothetical protein
MPSPLFNSLAKQYGTGVSGGGSPLFRSLQQKYGGSASQPPKPPDQIYSGNAFMDVIDSISIPGYAVAALAHATEDQDQERGGSFRGYDAKRLLRDTAQGVKNRASWRDFLKEHPLFGVNVAGKSVKVGGLNVPVADAVGTVLDIFVDPADMVVGPALGLAGKGIAKGSKAVGLTDAVRAIPAPQKLLDAIASGTAKKPGGLTRVTLKGKTLGEVVDTLATDTQALRKVFDAEDAAVRAAAKVSEPIQETVESLGKWSKPVKELMGDYIEAPSEKLAAEVLERLRKQLQGEGVAKLGNTELIKLVEQEARRAGFENIDQARMAARATDGQTLFRGEMVPQPSGAEGSAKNIAHKKSLAEAVWGDDADTFFLKKHQQHFSQQLAERRTLADALAQELAKNDDDIAHWERVHGLKKRIEWADDGIRARQEAIDDLTRSLADKADIEKIVAENNDLVFLTSQTETAEAYAHQLDDLPEALVGPKPEGYNPTVHEFKANFTKTFDLTKYGENGVLSWNDAGKVLDSMGVSEKDAEFVLNNTRWLNDSGDLSAYSLFRGKNLPIVRRALEASGFDSVHYLEGEQDNWIALTRTGLANASEVRKTAALSPQARSLLATGKAVEGVPESVASAEMQFVRDATNVREADAHLLRSKQAAGLLTNTAENAQHLRRTYLMYEDPAKWSEELLSLPPDEFGKRMTLLRNFGIEPVLENGAVKGFQATGSGKRISTEELGSLLQRSAIPPDVRAAMGEIKDAEYRLIKSAKADANLVAKKKFQEQVAEMFVKDFYPPGFAPGARTARNVEDVAWQTARKAGYAMMPDDKDAWGALAGQWVPEVVAKYLQEPRLAKGGALQQLIGLWKAGKTIANPATHVRNSLTNDLLTDWGTGLTPLSPRWWQYKGAALKALTQHNDDFKQAKEVGTFLSDTFRAQELSKILDNGPLSEGKLKAVYGWLNKAGKKPGDLYEFEEQLGKMTIYLSERDKLLKGGADLAAATKQAAETADKWLINYRRVPKWVDLVRNGQGPLGVLGTVPFITFSYKVTPLVAEAMIKHPTRVTKYFKAGRGIEALSDPAETDAEKRVMPEWMKEGIWLKLPMKDKYDRSLYLDATYLIPLADLSGAKVVGPGGAPAMMSTPFVDLIQDVMRNQSRFTGRPIWGQGMAKEDIAKNVGEYIGSQLLPSLAPGGYGYRNIRDAVAKKPDWLGRTRTLDQVLAAQLLGMKTRPINYGEEAMYRQKEFEDEINAIKVELRKRMADPAISEDNKQRAWERAMQLMNDVFARMEATFGD